jgi:hypothetical protein
LRFERKRQAILFCNLEVVELTDWKNINLAVDTLLLFTDKCYLTYFLGQEIAAYIHPPPACYGRRLVLPRMTIQEMNKQPSIINRVVIHPKYLTIGLPAKLVSQTLPLVGMPYVEMIAVMAKYNPFAEKAGMRKNSRTTIGRKRFTGF